MLSTAEENVFDVVVIGAGIEGSCTAYQLARDGIKTLLLEQFVLPSSRGSSHGQTRCTRKFYCNEIYDDANLFLLEHEAGILRADKCLNAAQELFKRLGGILRDGEMVQNIVPGEIVHIHTQDNLYTAKNVVITAGPWTSKLLQPLRVQLPIQPLRILVCYFREKIAGTYKMPHVPITLYKLHNRDIFTVPSFEYPNLTKVIYCDGPHVDPENPDRNPDASKEYLEKICNHVKDNFPGLEPIPSVIESGISTMTPDGSFILDHHPQHRNIAIGAGFSGHGFKLAPVVGKLLKQLVTGEKPAHDMSPFSMQRFDKNPEGFSVGALKGP
ncbi:peroxisomal sarcosine oxidase-like [Tubulanus polymorphus]|uniref:peroxisomal sarcosine oxidase-like n=1 Tax=Tubulanus polymorphus TaxID=672921 RepID=UPI003DA219A3